MVDAAHQDRIKRELQAAGMNRYGLLKAETRHLPAIIHENEHIHGAVYGRADGSGGMLVATDHRLLYLDHRILFKKTEDISYEVLSGVSYSKQGDAATITVHTRLGDFTLRFVNLASANRFVSYIEDKQIEVDKKEQIDKPPIKVVNPVSPVAAFSTEAQVFLASHDVGVVSTIDQHGNVKGAVVYYTVGADHDIFFVTKSQTEKAQDILLYQQVAMTVYDARTMQTIQISGTAEVERDPHLAEEISKRILRPRIAGEHVTVPPILHMSAGDLIVICIKPQTYKYHDFKSW